MIMHLQFSLVMKISSVVKINLPFTINYLLCNARYISLQLWILSLSFCFHFLFFNKLLLFLSPLFTLLLFFKSLSPSTHTLPLSLTPHTHPLSLSLHTHTHHSFKNTITSFINKNFTSEQLVSFSMFIISTSGRQSHFHWKGNFKATQSVMHTYAYMFNRWLYSMCIFK